MLSEGIESQSQQLSGPFKSLVNGNKSDGNCLVPTPTALPLPLPMDDLLQAPTTRGQSTDSLLQLRGRQRLVVVVLLEHELVRLRGGKHDAA